MTTEQFEQTMGLRAPQANAILNFLRRVGLARTHKELVDGRIRTMWTIDPVVVLPQNVS
jgi:hypothetical protein